MAILNFDTLEAIAVFSMGDGEYRKDAIKKPKNLENKLDDQRLTNYIADRNLQPITDKEKAYCIAWATLAGIKFGNEDIKVLLAIAETLDDHEDPSG